MKAVFTDIGKAIRWSVSLGNKFLRVVPGLTFLAVMCSVFSQFFLLIGFLLPLKVVLLLGSDSVPVYFPPIFHDFGRDGLVLVLSLAAVMFYLLHLATSKLVDIAASSASNRLLARSRKMAIFENQKDIAAKGYQRYSQSLAAVSFFSICLVVMAFFYSKVAMVIVGYVAVCFIFVGLLSSLSQAFLDRLHRDLGSIVKVLGSVGFLVTFAFIVLDHLFGSAPGIIVSVVSLLLGRQAFGRMANLIKDIQGLYGQRAQLAALFFHGRIFMQRPKGLDKGIWGLVEPEVRDEWLGSLLEEVVGGKNPEFTVEWFDLGLPDVLCYQVGLVSGEDERSFLVKVFNANRSAWAKHEATILVGQSDLPTVPCVSLTLVHGLHCHVFETTGLIQCSKPETAKKLPDFRVKLSACEPSHELASLYLRSHPQVWQRVEPNSIRRTGHLLGQKAESDLIEKLLSAISDIKATLKELPHAVSAPDIRVGMLWKDSEGNCLLVHWAVWNIEPLGTKWPLGDDEGSIFVHHLQVVEKGRSEVADLNPHRVRLAAIFSELEFRLTRGRYLEAYSLMSPLLSEYERT
ncbi:MAG: hypothetical protein JJ867_00280 [Marinobacter sp.]|nr:hypothetical protein [Marinobacter sp.]